MKLLRRIINALPKKIRGGLNRRFMKLNFAPTEQFVFKLAQTEDEVRQSMHILYEAYRSCGLQDQNALELRVTKYHLLPSTSIILIKEEDTVIGTLMVIQDNPLGLPSDKLVDVAQFRKGYRIAEISALAIRSDYRSNFGLYFNLTKYMWLYTRNCLNLEMLIVVATTMHIELYEDIFLFKPIDENVITYKFANGLKSKGLFLNLIHAPFDYFSAYSGKSGKQDLFSFMTNPILTNPRSFLPRRDYYKSFDYSLSFDVYKNLFVKGSTVIQNLEDKELFYLASVFSGAPKMIELFKENTKSPDMFIHRRKFGRYPVYFLGILEQKGTKEGLILRAIEVGYRGFQAKFLTGRVKLDETYQVALAIGPNREIVAAVTPKRQQGENLYYFEIEENPYWFQMVKTFEEEFNYGQNLVVSNNISQLKMAG